MVLVSNINHVTSGVQINNINDNDSSRKIKLKITENSRDLYKFNLTCLPSL